MTEGFRRLAQILFAAICVISFTNSNAAPPRRDGSRIHLIPYFAQGQTFRYSVQTRIETASSATGPVADMGGPKKLAESIGVVIRLDVLSVSNALGGFPSTRIRATYEKAAATTNSTTYDPDAAAIQDQYKKLAGQSIEFTLQSDGKIAGITGIKDLASDSDPSRAIMLNQWLSQLTLGASLPKQGIEIGQKWTSVQPLTNIPLDGLSWKTAATYVRNEACPSATKLSPTGGVNVPPAAEPDQCAVIMTHSEIVGGRDSKERTPEAFRQNGLRTSGVWTGAAESLTAVSLRTGLVASVTETGSTHMDFTIMTVTAHNRMRYAGDTQTQSEITLLSPSAIP
jgi:hypothetical protein